MMGMPTCREVTRTVASGSLGEASFLQRIGFRMHVMMCRHCRRYARQIRALGMAARELLTRPSGERESFERLRKALLGRVEPPAGE